MINTNVPNWEQKVMHQLLQDTLKEQRRKRRWGIFFKLMFGIWLILMLVVMLPEHTLENTNKPHVALIDIKGTITDDDHADADQIATGLQSAFKNKHTKGVILRINSPGGSPVQAAYVYDEIRRQRKLHKNIPVYAVCTDVCASAAYYIASAADSIYANPSSLVGSIGALMNSFGFVDSLKKLGVERRLFTAGESKGFLDPFSPLKKNDVAHVEKMLANVHQEFISSVIAGRGKRLKQTPEMFSGLIWSGKEALALGLIDGFGSAGHVAREIIKQDQIVDYTVKPNYLERFTKQMGASFSQSLMNLLHVQRF